MKIKKTLGEILKEYKDDFTEVRFDYGRVQEHTSILDIIKIPERRLNLKVMFYMYIYLLLFVLLRKIYLLQI